jgi:Flp pilus assembly pilin Flp
MNKFIKNFLNEEDGAVTVDWVVLTAAVVGLGVAGVAAVKGGVDNLASSISTEMTSATVVSLGELGQSTTSEAPAEE